MTAALAIGAAVLSLLAFVLAARAAIHSERRLRESRDDIARLHAGLPMLLLRIRIAPDGAQITSVVGGQLSTMSFDTAGVSLWLTGWGVPDEPGARDCAAAVARAGRDGSATGDYRVHAADGSWEWLRLRLRRMNDAASGSLEVAGYVTEVTAEREATGALLACGRLSAMGELAAGLVHELRQPLAAISMATENADESLNQGDLESARRKLQRIARQTARAGALIEHLRRFARGGDLDTPQPVRLDTVVAGACEIAGGALRDSGIAMEASLGDPPPMVLCQRMALEQVFVNLLINARDVLAARPQGALRRIRISATVATRVPVVTVNVADSGGGIAPGVMRRLFEPFVTTKGPDEGTGLGLAICRRLLTGMGGDITAVNGDEGAVFIISLQAAPVEQQRSVESTVPR